MMQSAEEQLLLISQQRTLGESELASRTVDDSTYKTTAHRKTSLDAATVYVCEVKMPVAIRLRNEFDSLKFVWLDTALYFLSGSTEQQDHGP